MFCDHCTTPLHKIQALTILITKQLINTTKPKQNWLEIFFSSDVNIPLGIYIAWDYIFFTNDVYYVSY